MRRNFVKFIAIFYNFSKRKKIFFALQNSPNHLSLSVNRKDNQSPSGFFSSPWSIPLSLLFFFWSWVHKKNKTKESLKLWIALGFQDWFLSNNVLNSWMIDWLKFESIAFRGSAPGWSCGFKLFYLLENTSALAPKNELKPWAHKSRNIS